MPPSLPTRQPITDSGPIAAPCYCALIGTCVAFRFNDTGVKSRSKFPCGAPDGGEILYVRDTIALDRSSGSPITAHDKHVARIANDHLFHFASTARLFAEASPCWLTHTSKQDHPFLFADPSTSQSNFMKPRHTLFIDTLKPRGPLLSRK